MRPASLLRDQREARRLSLDELSAALLKFDRGSVLRVGGQTV